MSTTRRDFIKRAALTGAAVAVLPETCVESLAGEPENNAPEQGNEAPAATIDMEGTEAFAAAVAVGSIGGGGKEPNEKEQIRMSYAIRIMNEYNIPPVKGALGLETEDDIEKSRLENALKLTDQISREGWYQFGAGIAGGLAADALLKKVRFDFSGRQLVNIVASTAINTVAERKTKVSSIIAPTTQPETLMDKYYLAEADAVRFYEDHKKYSSVKTASGALTGAMAYEAKGALHKGFKTVQKILNSLHNKSEPTEPGVY